MDSSKKISLVNPTRRSLSVALAAPEWPPGISHNGIVASLSKLAPSLKSQGTQVSILAESLCGGFNADNLEPDVLDISHAPRRFFQQGLGGKLANRISPGATFARSRAASLAHALRHSLPTPVDLVELEESFGTSYFLQRQTRIPVILRLHGPVFLTGKAMGVPNDRHFRERVALEGKAFKAAPAVSAPSNSALQETTAYYQYCPKLTRVIPNAQPLLPAPERWHPIKHTRHSLVLIGRFDRVKGADLAIDAFQQIAREYRQATLTIVGPDNGIWTNDGNLEKFDTYVSKRVSDESTARRIKHLGSLPAENVSALRQRAALILVCSRYETFSNALVEAMAQACPVVSSDAGGMRDIAQHKCNALVFPSGSASALADCIRQALDNPRLMAKLADNALSHCASAFSPDRVAADTLNFYHEALDLLRS